VDDKNHLVWLNEKTLEIAEILNQLKITDSIWVLNRCLYLVMHQIYGADIESLNKMSADHDTAPKKE